MKAQLETQEHDEHIVEQAYECQTRGCGNVQTLRFWKHETQLPATCCVKCKAGFGQDMSYAAMAANGIGMLPVEAMIQ